MVYIPITFLVLILISMDGVSNIKTKRIKRAHSQKFNTLLRLYKMNPMRTSNVFKTYSNKVLSYKAGYKTPVYKESSERIHKEDYIIANIYHPTEGKTLTDFELIEDIIHVPHNKHEMVSRHYAQYAVANEQPEEFEKQFPLNLKKYKEDDNVLNPKRVIDQPSDHMFSSEDNIKSKESNVNKDTKRYTENVNVVTNSVTEAVIDESTDADVVVLR